MCSKVVDVTQQHGARRIVARGTDNLRKIDHHWPIRTDQYVVRGQVAMNQPAAQHQHYLPHQHAMVFTRVLRTELNLT